MGVQNGLTPSKGVGDHIRKLASEQTLKKAGVDPRFNHPDDVKEIQDTLPDFQAVTDDTNKVIGYHSKGGYMIAAITDYNGTSCEVSGMAKGKWFHTSIYADLFGYIFKTLECKRINFVVDTDNYKCIELLEKGGCVRECKLRGIDRYLYSMIPEDFYGQERTKDIKTA